jgi:ubiquinone/menaquinone biosynthesis C-methylase UbiE
MVRKKQKAAKVYDETAVNYDLRSGNPYTERVRAAEARLIRRYARGRILDAGCGTGYHLRALNDVVGVDVSEEMLKQARKVGKHVEKADIERLPFGQGEFDTVLCLYSVLNVCNWREAVKEICRVIKSKGMIVVSVSSLYDKGYKNLKEKRLVRPDEYTQTKKIHIEGRKLWLHLFTREELEEEYEKHGLVLEEFDSVFRGVKPKWGLWKRFSLSERFGLLLDRFRPKKYGSVYLMVFGKE